MKAHLPAAKTSSDTLQPDDQGAHPLTLIFESRPQRAALDEIIIREALCNPILVLDAGNCFNPLQLTQKIRKQTQEVIETLERIQVARAFTCFQVVTLLEETRDPKGPVFILRLLTTFVDEMIPVYERLRLLKQVDGHIERLRTSAAVRVMIRNSHFQDEPLTAWFSNLHARADAILYPEIDLQPEPATLF